MTARIPISPAPIETPHRPVRGVAPCVVEADGGATDGWDDAIRGRIRWQTLFSAGLTASDSLTAGVAELQPGGWLGLHRHDPAEIYYILAGSGTLTLCGEPRAVSAGMAVFIPGDAEHGIRNDGDAPLRFLYAFAADSFDAIDYRFS